MMLENNEIKNEILRLVRENDGQFSWYNLSIRIDRKRAEMVPPTMAYIEELVSDGLIRAEASPDGQQTHYFITEAKRAEVVCDKVQFAVLLEQAVGDPFILNDAALADLAVSSDEIEAARSELARAGHLQDGRASAETVALLQTVVSEGWKCVADVRAQSADWSQISLHFGDDLIVGEAFNEREERLLTQLSTVDEAVMWLLGLFSLRESSGNRARRTLDKLLPKAEVVVTFLVIDGADDSENAAKSASVFLQTDKGLWFIDSDAEEQRAANLTVDRLREKLVGAVQQFVS